jgi:hypothetical protein
MILKFSFSQDFTDQIISEYNRIYSDRLFFKKSFLRQPKLFLIGVNNNENSLTEVSISFIIHELLFPS